ncbi:MAG: SLOG family protein [Rikenellaceae bacterium]
MTIGFTGHRKYTSAQHATLLRNKISKLCEEDPRAQFLCGMAVGFDLAAGECVLELKEQFPDIELIAVRPYASQSEYFSDADKLRYDNILAQCDDVITMAENYSIELFSLRNNYIIDNSDYIVTYLDTNLKKGGTRHTIMRAKRKAIPIDNIFPSAQLSLF